MRRVSEIGFIVRGKKEQLFFRVAVCRGLRIFVPVNVAEVSLISQPCA